MSRRRSPSTDLNLVRARLRSEAEVLEGVHERLHQLAAHLPSAQAEAALRDEQMPGAVARFMAEAAVCTADDTLGPAITQLRRAAAVTAADLREEFDSTHADPRRSRAPSAPRAGHKRKEP